MNAETTLSASFNTGDGARINYRLDGPAGAPLLVLSNSIATTLHMWDDNIAALARHFRILRYDARGHGRSDAPHHPYSLDRLGRDVLELLDALDLPRVHFIGLSLGGFVGQWLAIHAPERIDRLVLANTSSYLGASGQWDAQIAAVLDDAAMEKTAATFLGNWFPQRLLDASTASVESIRAALLSLDRHGIAGSLAAVRDADLRRTIALIGAETLVIAGRFDTVTRPEHGELIARTIPGAKLELLPVVHMANVEMPEQFGERVVTFLLRQE